MRVTLFFLTASLSLLAAEDFSRDIKPTLTANCASCHNPTNPRNRHNFLKADSPAHLEQNRLLWRSVSAQLRNRTMPPGDARLSEADRLRISQWIDQRLKSTACSAGESAYAVPPRRLNRREYQNTIRDLLGLEIVAADLFPADEAGGAGFDTNGDTLYLPPMLLERYLEAAQKILDRVIITPPFSKQFPSAEMTPPLPSPKPGRMLAPHTSVSAETLIFVEGSYNLRVSIERPRNFPVKVRVSVDGQPPTELLYARDSGGGPTTRISTVPLTRGVHSVKVESLEHDIQFYSLTIEQRQDPAPLDKRALHFRLFGREAGQSPVDPDRAARRLLQDFLARAWRRPVTPADTEPFFALYQRAFRRGDPYEESLKMALKTILVSPRFLFRAEDGMAAKTVTPVSHYDMASRLSYFLWSTAPDSQLLSLAAQNKLNDPATLRPEVDRLLDDPRSRAFSTSFIGQWLGTQEVGGRVVPLLTELQHYYTPEIAAELREEPVLLFDHLLATSGSLLDLLNSNYSFLTARLAKFYQIEDKLPASLPDRFTKVTWPDSRRGGVLGMAGVLAMTSHYKLSSPVLRGAWVLDNLLGTPVPPPPPDVPPLDKAAKSEKGLTMFQILERHRTNSACASCHNLMDPIGFGLETFDWMGRTQTDPNIHAKGALPSGESFNGPTELRQVLLSKKEDFLRHLTAKVLGYALGRAIGDADQCTLQRIVEKLEANHFNARLLIHEVVQSSAFRNHHPTPVSGASPSGKTIRTRLLGDK